MNDESNSSGRESKQVDAHAHALARLTELARDRLPPAVSPGASSAAYARFNRTASGARHGKLRLAGTVALPVGAIVVALVGLATWRRMDASRPLSVTVARGALDEGGFVRAAASATPSLHFSDGTEVDLGIASRARVAGTTRHGARVLLEDGGAAARVVPRHGSQWFFDAGPCRVLVTGTRFDMHWSASEQILEVMLYNGAVVVQGPPASAGVPMRAGQRLVMDVRQGSVRLSDLPASSPPSVDATAPPEQPAVLPSHDEVPRAAENDRTRRREGWEDRVLSGEFGVVIHEARRRGVDRVLARENAGNVMALADAARYTGDYSLAHKALLAVRSRFPHTAPAQRAAFLLGRIAEDQHGNLGKALDWYDTYLSGADDAFRAEAMGRQMTATLRLGRAEQAHTLAARYLERYPQGAYARAARGIMSR